MSDIVIFFQDKPFEAFLVVGVIFLILYILQKPRRLIYLIDPFGHLGLSSSYPIDSKTDSKVLNKGVWIWWVIVIIFIVISNFWRWWY